MLEPPRKPQTFLDIVWRDAKARLLPQRPRREQQLALFLLLYGQT